VRRILVTGMSGTGKSSALAELASRGLRVVDTDDPGWKEEVDGEPVWREDRIGELLAEDGDTPLVVSGCVANQGRFYDRLDAVVLLSAPARVLLERVATRPTNDYGKASHERRSILADLAEVEPLLRATCTHELDATRPLSEVVADLEAIARGVSDVPD
jgi:dephospho-CoA kinase